MKQLLFTAALLVAFSGFANAKNNVENLATIQSSQFLTLKKATHKDLEKKDALFCYKASETTTHNPFNGETTVTTVYHCTEYNLSQA
jgi:hypothetical protein